MQTIETLIKQIATYEEVVQLFPEITKEEYKLIKGV
jgi:hypothetical protein